MDSIEGHNVETNTETENGGDHTYDTTLDEWSSGDESAPPTEKRRKMDDSNPTPPTSTSTVSQKI